MQKANSPKHEFQNTFKQKLKELIRETKSKPIIGYFSTLFSN